MGTIRSISKGASALKPFVNVVRGVERASGAPQTITVLDGQPQLTGRLREIIGASLDTSIGSADGPIVYAAAPGHDPTLAAAVLAGAKRDGRVVLAIVTGTPNDRNDLERAILSHPPLEPSNIAHVAGLENPELVVPVIARILGDAAVPVARAHPPMRNAVADELIARAARQSATVGAAMIVPGADLPAITLVQVRLVAQLAAAYGRPLDARRGLEVAGIIVSAFGWRAVARRAVASVPVAGFAVRGGVAYSATRAVGEAAKAYFDRAGDRADAPLGGLQQALQGALRKRGAK